MKTFDPDIEAMLGGTPAAPSNPMAFGGAYEGASRREMEMALWQPALRSANADIMDSKYEADARSRDINRNDAYVQSGGALHRDSIVGSTFLLNALPEIEVLGRQDSRLDETWSEEFQEEIETEFNLAAESWDCWFDAERTKTLTEMIRLDVAVHLYGGESLSTVEWIRENDRPFRTAIQCVEVDRLATPTEMIADPSIVGGVKLNRYGAPVGFYIRESHPSDWRATNRFEYKYVPARKPWGRTQVIHIKEQVRPQQTRGIAEMVAALKEMKTTKKFRDITLQNAVINASYAASIESEFPEQALAAIGMGQNHNPGDFGAIAVDFAQRWMTEMTAYAGKANGLQIDGARIPHLFPGTRLQMRPMGSPGGVGGEFEASLLRYIAANLGLSYEELSRDFSKSNYSSIRAAMAQTGRYMQSKKKIIADRKASMVYRLWFEEKLNSGTIQSMPRNVQATANFYEGLNADAYTSCSWIGAGRGMIDELKETQAAVLRLKNNLTTLEFEHARIWGTDWRKKLRQIAREKKMMTDLDVLPADQDPNMMNAASGTPRDPGTSDRSNQGASALAESMLSQIIEAMEGNRA